MSILARIFNRPAQLGAEDSRWWLPWISSRTSTSGASVDATTSLSLSAVFAGVSTISNVLGMLPRSVYRRNGRTRDVASEHPVHYLLHTAPNPEMTAKRCFQQMEFNRLLWGNAYAEIEWAGNGRPLALWPIEPWRVCPKRDANNQLYYRVDNDRDVHPDEMLHVPLVSFDGVCGRSFIEFAIDSLGLGISAQEFAGTYFGNGAIPNGYLYHPGNPTPKARDEFRESYNAYHGGKKSNKTAVMWGGWDLKPYQTDPEKAQLLESRQFHIEEVARWLNLPPHILRDLLRATFSNIEHQGIELVTYTFGPVLADYEQEYDRKLLNPPDLYSKHNVLALLRGDSAQRAAWYTSMFQVGAYTTNEIRDYEDLNPVPEGDKRFVAVNMQTLDKAGMPIEPAPVPQDPQQQQPPANMSAFRFLFVSTLRRLVGYEARCARQAAKKPKEFLVWLQEFYPRHEQAVLDALGPIAAVTPVSIGSAPALAAAVCKENRAAFEALYDTCSPAKFEQSVESLVSSWEEGLAEKLATAIFDRGESCRS